MQDNATTTGENESRGGLPLAAKARRTTEQPISFLIAEALRNPLLINLAAGLVDPLTLPVDECLDITRRIFSDTARGRAALQYDTTLGLRDLRQQVLKHIEKLEGMPASALNLTADDIMVSTGSQQALYLIGDVLIDPGDIMIAANPSYFVYTGTLASLGAKVHAVPMDDDGMDVEAVDRLLAKLEREGMLPKVKLIYCTSYYQNPTGLTLSAARRPRLLEIAKKYSKHHRILILEDAAYRELRYDGPAHRSIKSYDPDNLFTIISHTFSKPFAPGLKLGYSAMPADLLHAVLQQKGNHDFGSANLTQHIALEAMRDGSYDKHVEVLKAAYRLKRDAVLAALEKSFGPRAESAHSARHPERSEGSPVGDNSLDPEILRSAQDDDHSSSTIHWTIPHGGLYTWLTLPETFDTSRGGKMFQACIDAGVLYVPGDYCFQPDASGRLPKNCIRLSFGQVAPDKIVPGIERLAGVVKSFLPSRSEASNSKTGILTPP